MKGCTEAVKYLFSLCIFVSFVSCVSAKEHLKEASISAGNMKKSNMMLILPIMLMAVIFLAGLKAPTEHIER